VNTSRSLALLAVLLVGIVLAAAALSGGRGGAEEADASAASYHEQRSPTPGVADSGGHAMPLPAVRDREAENAMTAADIAMVTAAASMETVAETMIGTGDPALTELGRHWLEDARALATRGAWMITSATSDSMVHDPANARALNLANLRANGVTMEMEGAAMAEHGRAMVAQVEQLRAGGRFDATVLENLTARGQDLITAGQAMETDGKRMQDEADALARSLGG
jgi:hypothetical protein